MAEFLLPDLGEGLEEAQLVQWLVQVGDHVTLNQPLCQVETAKALVDVPSPFAGVVEKLHAGPGDTVLVGHPLISIARVAATKQERPADGSTEGGAADGHGPVLVGYGTEGPTEAFSRRRRAAASVQAPIAGRGDRRTRQSTGPQDSARARSRSGHDQGHWSRRTHSCRRS